MDTRTYYQKIREMEACISGEFVVVISNPTGDGGKRGRLCEVSRPVAARMAVDGTAELATAEQTAAFRQEQAAMQKAAEEAARARNLAVTLVPAMELKRLSDQFEQLKSRSQTEKE